MKRLLLFQKKENDFEFVEEFESRQEADEAVFQLKEEAKFNHKLLGTWYIMPAQKIVITRP